MREIGTIADERGAEVFKDHLLANKISSKLVKNQAGWAVWIHNEDVVPRAREELSSYMAEPDAARYRESSQVAKGLEKAAATADKSHRKNVRELRDRWEAPAWRKYPLTVILIFVSIYVALSTDFGRKSQSSTFQSVLFARTSAKVEFEADRPAIRWTSHGFDDIRKGEVWRLVTPIFLHFGIPHLVGNMLCLQIFGGKIEFRKGTLRFLLLVLASAILSNVGQSIAGSMSPELSVFGGMSGVGYALFGYLWTKGFSRPDERLGVDTNTVFMMILWFGLCASGMIGPVANTAHGVGLIFGMLVGLTRF